MREQRLRTKITAVRWLQAVIKALEDRMIHEEINYLDYDIHQLWRILGYIKVAPAPRVSVKGKKERNK